MKAIFTLICISVSMLTFGQLSDRVNNPSTFKFGTRPVSGDLGFSIGTSVNDVTSILDEQDYKTLPLFNIKYYIQDDLVFTIGLKNNKKKTVYKGEVNTTVDASGVKAYELRDIEQKFMLSPGFEKHFLPTNIFDAYIGGRVPLGYVRDIYEENTDFENNDYDYLRQSQLSFVYGIQFMAGVQFFIADLPLSLGAEIEMSGIGYRGNKVKCLSDEKVGGTTTTEKYFLALDDAGALSAAAPFAFSKLRSRTWETETDFRISLNYYFRK